MSNSVWSFDSSTYDLWSIHIGRSLLSILVYWKDAWTLSYSLLVNFPSCSWPFCFAVSQIELVHCLPREEEAEKYCGEAKLHDILLTLLEVHVFLQHSVLSLLLSRWLSRVMSSVLLYLPTQVVHNWGRTNGRNLRRPPLSTISLEDNTGKYVPEHHN